MIGLYQKAIELLNKEIESTADSLNFDESSGITKEDQKDILEQINKITSESKISVTPEVFNIKSEKKGTLLPFLVNLLAVFILGSFIIFQYFSSRNTGVKCFFSYFLFWTSREEFTDINVLDYETMTYGKLALKLPAFVGIALKLYQQ